jgi:hypothetical protein
MAISVVQAQAIDEGDSFTNNVTAGNTVFIVPICYEFGSSTIDTSNPTLGGNSVPGSQLLTSIQNPNDSGPGGGMAYTGVWMMPNCPGGSSSIGLSIAAGNFLDMIVFEVAGLGTAPTLSQSSVGQNLNSYSLSSGATGSIAEVPQIIIGGGTLINLPQTLVGSPWTSVQDNTKYGQASYQIATTTGGSYTWATTAVNDYTNSWAACCVTVQATNAVIPTFPGLLLTSFL